MKIKNKRFISSSSLLSVWITSVIAMVNGADLAGMYQGGIFRIAVRNECHGNAGGQNL